MGYDFTQIMEKASRQEYYEIPVTQEALVFLVKQGHGTIAQKLNEAIDNGLIKLPKMGDLSVKEHLGFRNDRFNDARRKELIAAIGEAKKCSKETAEKIFSDMTAWKTLPQDLQDDLASYFTAAIAESIEQSLPARQITTIIQERLIKDWQLEWTLLLPKSILEPFLAYFEGEATGWNQTSEEDYIDVVPTEGENGSIVSAKTANRSAPPK